MRWLSAHHRGWVVVVCLFYSWHTVQPRVLNFWNMIPYVSIENEFSHLIRIFPSFWAIPLFIFLKYLSIIWKSNYKNNQRCYEASPFLQITGKRNKLSSNTIHNINRWYEIAFCEDCKPSYRRDSIEKHELEKPCNLFTKLSTCSLYFKYVLF